MTTDIYPLIKNEIMGIEEVKLHVIDIECKTDEERRDVINMLVSKDVKGVGDDFIFAVAPFVRYWSKHKEYQTMVAANDYAGAITQLITAQDFIKQNS